MAGIFEAKVRVAAKSIAPGASSDSSYTENVAILPANAYVMAMFGRVKTAFAGLTKPKVSLGVSGDTDRYIVAQPADFVNELIVNHIGAFSASNSAIGVKNFCAGMNKEKINSTGQTVIATFTSSSSDFSGLTAGEVEFLIVFVDPNQYVNVT
jgi:hypothetical protein